MKTTSKTTLMFITAIAGLWMFHYAMHYFGIHVHDDATGVDVEIYFSLAVTILLIILTVAINFILTKKESITNSLKENERKLEEIIENSNEWIWELDNNGIFTYSSHMVEKILGYKAEEVTGQYKYEIFFAKKFKKIANGLFNRHRKFTDIISQNITKDNRIVWLKHTGVPLFDEDKNFIGYRGVTKNFSEQKAARDTLQTLSKTFSAVSGEDFMQKMCEHLSNVLNVAYAFVGEVNTETNSVSIITGVSFSKKIVPFEYSLEGTPCANVVDKSICCYPDKVREHFPNDKILEDLNVVSYIGAPIHDVDGNPTGILVVLDTKPIEEKDLALMMFNVFLERTSAEIERIRSQREIAQSEEFFRNLFNNSPVGMFQSSIASGNVINCNSKFSSMIGYSLFELKKCNCSKLWFNPSKRDEMLALAETTGIVNNFETKMITKSGDLKDVSLSLTIYKKQGYLEAAVTDITETKLIEETRKAILKLNNDASSMNVEQIIASGLDKIKNITSSENVFFYMVDNSNFSLPRFISINRNYGIVCSEERSERYIDQNLLTECIENQKSILVNKPAGKILRSLYIPIVEQDKVLCIIGLTNKNYNYSILEADQLTILADSLWNVSLKKTVEEKLIISETNFRTFFDSVDSYIFIIDYDKRIVTVNNRVVEKFELRKEKFIGKEITYFYPYNKKEQAISILDKIINEEENYYSLPLVGSNGFPVEVETNANLGYWNSQKVVFLVCTDVSLLRNSEKQLEKSEKNLRTFFDTVDNMLFVFDRSGNIISVNLPGLKKLGYEENEIIGKNILSLYPAQHKSEALEFVTNMIEGTEETCTLPFVDKDGKIIHVETKVKTGIWNGEQVLFGVTTDLSLLKESEEKFSKAFHSSSVAMSIHSVKSGAFYDINNTFTEVFGYEKYELIGKTVKKIGLILDESSLDEVNTELSKSGYVRNFIQEFTTKNQKKKIGAVSINKVTMFGKEYELVAINDITELKEKENRLAESEQNLKKAQSISNLGNWNWNLKTNKIICSDEAYNIFELDSTIVPTIDTVVDKIFPDDIEIFKNGLELAYKGTPLESNEVRIITDNKNIKYIKIITEIEHQSSENLFGTVQDVTKLKTAEAALIESEEQFRSLAENTYDAIARYDREHRYLYVNKAVLGIAGLAIEQVIGKTNQELGVEKNITALWDDGLEKVFKTGVFEHQVFDWYSEGEVLTFDGRMYPEFDDKGEVKSVLCVSRDITEFTEAQHELLKLSNAVEQNSALIVITNLKGEIEYVNQKFVEVTQYEANEVIGKSISLLKSGEIPDAIYKDLWITITKGNTWTGELLNSKKDGTLFWESDTISPIKDNNGNIINYVAIKEDITEFKILEKEQNKLLNLIDTSLNEILILDAVSFKPIYANKTALQNLQYSIEELREIRGDLLIVDTEINLVKQFVQELLSNKRSRFYLETKVKRKNGSYYPVEIFIQKSKEDSQEIIFIAIDVTEKKIAERELEEYREHLELLVKQRTNQLSDANRNLEIEMKKYEESEEKFRALAENAEDTIMRFDRSLKHMYVNPIVEKSTGIDALEFIGKNHEELGFPEHLTQIWEEALIQVFESGASNRIEFMLPNGIWVDWSILPEFDEKGEVTSLLTVGRDITDRKNMELKVAEALKKEKELNDLKSKFISTTSHEFRTPLTAIMSSTELLERYGRKWDEVKYNQHISRIIKSIEYLTNLMNDILTISRAESGKLKYVPAKMDLYETLHEVINDVEVLKTPNHEIIFNYELENKEFVFDKKLLTMVFLNILSNAIKYSPDGGEISIQVYQDTANLILKITDEGIGIPEKDIPSLFEAFYRSENTLELPGTGLGLSIVKTAIGLHEGSVKVESKENVGTTFTIQLPI